VTERFPIFAFQRAIRGSHVSGHEKAVAMMLSTYASEEGIAFPSLETLADASGFSRATVCRAIDALVAAKWIRKVRQSRTTSNTYQLQVMGSAEVSALPETSPVETSPAASSQAATSPVDTSDVATGDVRGLPQRLATSLPETLSTHVTTHVTSHGTPQAVLLTPDQGGSSNGRASEVSAVFDHWTEKQSALTGASRASLKLTKEREKAVKARLRGGKTVDDLKRAVDGCFEIPHNRNGHYTDLELICRTDGHVERYAAGPPRTNHRSGWQEPPPEGSGYPVDDGMGGTQ
jgi:hypothetical protein